MAAVPRLRINKNGLDIAVPDATTDIAIGRHREKSYIGTSLHGVTAPLTSSLHIGSPHTEAQ